MTIYNSTFNNNFATNASVNYNIQYSNLTVNKSQFNHNQAELDGGVNFNADNSDIHLLNSNFTYNNATYGGAVHNNNTGTITLKNSTFMNNGAMYGGVICNYGDGDIIIENSSFLNSNGMYGGVNFNDKGNIYFRNIYSANNTGTYGGENYNHDGFISIENSIFQNNTGRRIGGVNYNFENGIMIIKNSTFKNTQLIPSEGSIGGIDVCGGVNYNYIGAVMNITNSSFINNTSNSSGGVLYNMGDMNINNSIFTNNKAIQNGSAIYNIATLNITNSNFTNNFGVHNESIYTTVNIALTNNTIVNEIPTVIDQNTPLNSPILEVSLNTPVTYTIENNTTTISKNASNIITTTHTFTTNQTITIPINYPSYSANNTNISLIVIPARLNQTINATINTQQTTLNNLTITAILKDQNGNNITQQQRVTIKINGVTQQQLTINNGQLKTVVDTSNFTSKNYTVTIIVSDTTRYNKVEYTQNLEIINRNATINFITNTPEVLGQLVINVTLKDINTSTTEINNGFIIYKINGRTLRNADGSEIRTIVTNSTSQLIFNIPETIGKGTYNITAKYISSYYNRVENITFNLTITPKTIVNSTLTSITTTQKQNTTLNLTIKDEYGNVITGRIYSVVKINSVTYNRTYIEDGKLNVVLNTESFINPKYNITIKTGPSPLYTQAEFNMTLNIVKSDTTQTNKTKNIKTTNITTYNNQQVK